MSDSPPQLRRSAGVLLHVTSLPSRHGIGDLGPEAHNWVELLARCGQSWWQVLPLGPTGFGDSPYSSFSSSGGSTLLISPDLLIEDGLLTEDDVAPGAVLPAAAVDYAAVRRFKQGLLDRAWARFQKAAPALRSEFDDFTREHASWLDDFTLFVALKDVNKGASWMDWPRPLAHRDASALASARRELAEPIARHRFGQFLVFRQYVRLREHANRMGVRLFGDIPIFVAADSVDVWAHPTQFQLDANRRPRFVAGVPPDYFCPQGQLWGNPVYDWAAMRRDGYAWWTRRLKGMLRYFDLVRIDHFRGLEAAWHVPAEAETAASGQWVPGPGAEFLEHMQRAFGSLPLVAEDLGMITPAVIALRDQFHLAGMRVLQFAFDGDPKNWYLTHNYLTNSVVYSGTHDNDTTVGWFAALAEHDRERVRTYTCAPGHDIAWDLIRMAWGSVSTLAIVPLQDVLMLDSSARMNRPGVAEGNWRWRVTPDMPVAERMEGLRVVTHRYNRLP